VVPIRKLQKKTKIGQIPDLLVLDGLKNSENFKIFWNSLDEIMTVLNFLANFEASEK
jgi:hypothetical protein